MNFDFKSNGKQLLSRACRVALGRRNFARLSRFLWLESRLDVANGMLQNGESMAQQALLAYLGSRSGVVFDIGANRGHWSENLLRSAHQYDLKVVLFEPTPSAREIIEARLPTELSSSRAHLEPLAMRDTPGEASFHVNGPAAGTNSLRKVAGDPRGEHITVQCDTIDLYCDARGIKHVDFVKVDTEGNDCNVIEGAGQMLADRRISYMQFEYNYRWVAFRRYLKDVFDLVAPMGLSIGKLTPEGIEEYDRWHFELETYREGNYLIYDRDARLPMRHFEWWNQAAIS